MTAIVLLAAAIAAGCSSSSAVARADRLRCAALKRDAVESASKLLRENGYAIRMMSVELGVVRGERESGGSTQAWVVRYASDTLYMRASSTTTAAKGPVTTDIALGDLSPEDASWVLPIADGLAGICGIGGQ
jgi:hypothetical protein